MGHLQLKIGKHEVRPAAAVAGNKEHLKIPGSSRSVSLLGRKGKTQLALHPFICSQALSTWRQSEH